MNPITPEIFVGLLASEKLKWQAPKHALAAATFEFDLKDPEIERHIEWIKTQCDDEIVVGENNRALIDADDLIQTIKASHARANDRVRKPEPEAVVVGK